MTDTELLLIETKYGNRRRTTVSPRGTFVHHPRPTFTLIGNRGVLNDCNGDLALLFRTNRWLACSRSGTPNSARAQSRDLRRYTLLAFLDEATALAAGHRPCWTCRRRDLDAFRSAWAKGNGGQCSEGVWPV